MRRTLSRITLLAFWMVSLQQAVALEPQVCQERLKSVDERIASGKYPAQNVQIAKQMRDSIMQSCGFLDAATLDQMMVGFEELLPTKSEAEREAEREAKRAESDAQREIQRAELEAKRAERAKAEEERRRVEAQKPPVPSALKQPPTARSTLGRLIDRDDPMHQLRIHDSDYFDGKARVLYEAYPSQSQDSSPDVRRHYYVLEAGVDSGLTQHHVTEMPLDRFPVVGLRPGHDEVIFQWPTELPGTASTLERWSISKGRSLASAVTPELPWSTTRWSDQDYFRLTTTDGNLLFVGTPPISRGERFGTYWLKVSPDGGVVGKGMLQSTSESIGTHRFSRAADGGAALVIDVQNFDDDKGVESDLQTPIVRTVNNVDLEGVVVRELRLLIIDANAEMQWQSTALERQFVWFGLDKLGQSGSVEALQQASTITTGFEAKHGSTHSVRTWSSRGRSGEAVVEIGDAYGALVSVNSAGSEHQIETGDWLFEYASDGSVRKTYLESAAEHLGTDFVMLDAPRKDLVYLYARGSSTNKPHVVQLNGNREIVAYGTASIKPDTFFRGMLADEDGVWILGDARAEGQFWKVWVERIEFE